MNSVPRTGTDATAAAPVSTQGTLPGAVGSTRPLVRVKRKREAGRKRTLRRRELAEAADLERRAAVLTHTIATLDESRARLLVEAAMIRRYHRLEPDAPST